MGLFRKLKSKPALFLSTTGMQLERFEQLLPQFERAYEQLEALRKSRVVKTGALRQRQPGGGAQFSTELTERLLMLLLYYRGGRGAHRKRHAAVRRAGDRLQSWANRSCWTTGTKLSNSDTSGRGLGGP
jgi:hypothetical protein